MDRFRKKPVEIEARQWDGTAEGAGPIIDWARENNGTINYRCDDFEKCPNTPHHLSISTLEGDMKASEGDWIIKGIKGEFYPCKPDIFKDSYELASEPIDTGSISDGHHTFDELYRYRMLYNAALFNVWYEEAPYNEFQVHKSWKHSDGELCFGGGWFIVVAQLPTGQISNHYKEEFWPLFKIVEWEKAAKYDGHDPKEAAIRLEQFIRQGW